jgi:heterotetrameric sarcosine oxidase gamma subunit
MDNPPQGTATAVEIDGLSVSAERTVQIASLRYFHHSGRFAAAVGEAVGRALPEPLCTFQIGSAAQGSYVILAWRSPTETVLLSNDPAAFEELERQLAAAPDGCMVNQSGGICVLRVHGEKAGDLLMRLGAATAIPNLGEARSGRLAELQVLTACVSPKEYLLLVERVYANHLLEWIAATAADW